MRKVQAGPSPSKSERTKQMLRKKKSQANIANQQFARRAGLQCGVSLSTEHPGTRPQETQDLKHNLKNTNTREILETSQIARNRKPTVSTSTVQKCGPAISDALATHRVRGCTSPKSCKYILTNRDCSGVERRTTVLTRCPRHVRLDRRVH